MNLAHIVNEHLKALGWKHLTVTENIEPEWEIKYLKGNEVK